MGVVRRRELKARKEPSDAMLLRSAKASATRAANVQQKRSRAELARREAASQEPGRR